jgi:hypothetical protein
MEKPLHHSAPNSANGKPSDFADLELEELARQKVVARLRLLDLPPEEAQSIVEQTLYPQFWECSTTAIGWEESLPSHYGEFDT